MNIVFLDCTQNYGYQFSASNTKVEFMCKGLNSLGWTTSVINGICGKDGLKIPSYSGNSIIKEIITYPKVDPIIGWLKNRTLLEKDLKQLYVKNDTNIVVLSNVYIHLFNHYEALAHKLGYKVVAISHEWVPTIKRKYWIQNRLATVYAESFGKRIDGILPISEYIIKKIQHFNKPYLKTPILGDFSENRPSKLNKDKSIGFVYCVYANYYRVITIILKAYSTYVTTTSNPLNLTLVLSGPETAVKRVADEIKRLNINKYVSILTKVKYEDLILLYKQAYALLIPLDPNQEQDHARFSQKIAEYLSSGSPIISNNVGEISQYFTDKENIVITDYSEEGFNESFKWIESHPSEAAKIGAKGFELGKLEFDMITFADQLSKFLKNL